MTHLTPSQLLASVLVLGLAVCAAVLGRRLGRERDSSDGARRIGPYTLGEMIGHGAMGEVYRARHELLGRWCAIKVLSGHVSDAKLRRFETEVRLTAQLSHPNTVAVHDFGRSRDGSVYYVMELIEGVSLRELVEREGPQPEERVIHILRQLCAALGEAHGAGLVHRDIKPDNVMLCSQGGVTDVAKLLDFGLVKQLSGDSAASQSTNLLVGTPLYMSPEAIAAPGTVSPRSDLYALGAVAYYLLTGAPVFDGTQLVEVLSQHLYVAPQRPSRVLGRTISAELEGIVLDCLAKNPLERPASAAELALRLERCSIEPSPAENTPSSGRRLFAPLELEPCRACA